MKKSWFVIAAAVPLVVVGSIGVWQLSGGDQRRLGTLEPLKEPLPLAWRGAWSAEQGYAAGEVVAYDGLAYVAERRNEGSSPAPAQCGEDCPWTAMGSKGPKGDAGPPGGISGDEIIKNTKNVQAGYTEMSTQCPSGKRVLGGGVFATGGAVIAGSMPVDGGWLAGIVNNTGAAPGVSVHAVCANAT